MLQSAAGRAHPIFSIILEATPLVCVSNSPTPSFTTATRFFSATTFCLASRLRRSASCFTLQGIKLTSRGQSHCHPGLPLLLLPGWALQCADGHSTQGSRTALECVPLMVV